MRSQGWGLSLLLALGVLLCACLSWEHTSLRGRMGEAEDLLC